MIGCARAIWAFDRDLRQPHETTSVHPTMTTTPVDLSATLEVACDLQAAIGEGPIWDATNSTLLVVESVGGRIYRYHPAEGRLTSCEAGQPLGVAIPRRGGGLVASGCDGLLAVDERSGKVELLVPVERDNTDTRMNDAKCDSRGRLWGGTFSTTFAGKVGVLYRIDPDLRVTAAATGIYISNGIAWSPDESLMYYVDTARRGIDMFDYDIATGSIVNRRRFVDIDRPHGLPDGITVDAEGCLWVALFLGGAVRRYSPAGEWLGTVTLPVAGVTSCGFGGDGLTDLYITTGRHLDAKSKMPVEPQAGALFRCRPGVAGLPPHFFAG